MFNRYESYKKAIDKKSIDFNTLSLMIDFHFLKGNFTQEQGEELFKLMYPTVEEEVEETEVAEETE
jgi:hypothetical protein